jgi:mannosyltransferase OCH1-like enzyme
MPIEKVFKYKHANQYGHGKGSYAGFSDIFRYALLYKYGGWWVDMDVTCLKPFDVDEPYVFRSHHVLKIVGNIMKCPPQSTLMKLCYDEAIKTINAENTNWNKPIEILNRYIFELSLDKYIKTFSNQDQWRVIKKYLISSSYQVEDFYAIHWVNEEWHRHKISKNLVLKNSLLHNLYNQYQIPCTIAKSFDAMKLKFKTTTLYSGILLLKKPTVFFKTFIYLFQKK